MGQTIAQIVITVDIARVARAMLEPLPAGWVKSGRNCWTSDVHVVTLAIIPTSLSYMVVVYQYNQSDGWYFSGHKSLDFPA